MLISTSDPSGRLHLLTGGTTGAPKLVEYIGNRFEQVVLTKQRMLSISGICHESRVLVIHPMAPWAIGQVFYEGALRCGASVMPAGLSLSISTLSVVIQQFRPNVVCAGARNLQRLLTKFSSETLNLLTQDVTLVLSAGELLTGDVRDSIENTLACKVRDVYGCAELDALGLEDENKSGFWLVPDLEYVIDTGTGTSTLSTGVNGVLLARSINSMNWHRTGDLVRVLDSSGIQSPWKTHLIQIIGRERLCVKFGDGSAVGEEQLLLVRQSLLLDAIQLVVTRKPSGDNVKVLYHALCKDEISNEQVINALLSQCTDFADAFGAGCIGSLTAAHVGSHLELNTTERGKTPSIIILEDE